MKKVLSLLFVALLAMSAWADTVVTVDFSQQNFGDQQQIHELNIDGVILGFDKGTNSNNPPKYFNKYDKERNPLLGIVFRSKVEGESFYRTFLFFNPDDLTMIY